MTSVSFSDACRRLGIDAKTLHRWLAQAQLPLQDHPDDARKKEVSSKHLELLAHLHQRRLLPLSPEPPAPDAHSPLPAALLALPEQLAALQAQIAALQQQVADLTQRLPPPLHPSAPTKPAAPAKRAPTSPSRASRTPSPAKPPRKPAHVIARVEYSSQGRYVVICPKRGLLPIRPETPEWFAWVAEQDSFRFVGKEGHFTARHEWRVPKGAWRAYRHIRNHVYIQRLAPNCELTIAVLEQAALALQAHLT